MEYFDNTILQAHSKCPSFHYWKYVRHLIPINSVPIALEFGAGIHLALEDLYKDISLEEAINTFHVYFDKYEGQDSKRTLQLGKDIIKAYHELYFPEYFKVLMVEKSIQVILNKDTTFVGRADLVVEMNDGIYVMDHKTSSNVASVIDKPNHQFTGYVWGTKQQYGLDVKGTIINILGVFKTKREFLRKNTRRSESDIATWKCWFLSTTKKIKTALKALNMIGGDPLLWFPKETNSCFSYFRPCSYKDLCNCEDCNMRERLIEGMFKVEKWEPWKH